MKISNNDIRGAKKRGDKAEDTFSILMKQQPDVLKVEESSNHENKSLGIDFWITFDNNKRIPFDVKSLRLERRYGKDYFYFWKVLFEIVNIYGSPGSLYKKFDYFAIEFIKFFLIVKRLEVVKLVEKKVNLLGKINPSRSSGLWTTKNGYPLYELISRCEYNRNDGNPNEDVFTNLHIDDLEELKYKRIVHKPENLWTIWDNNIRIM